MEGAHLADLVAPAAREDVERVLDLMLTLSGEGGDSPGYLLEIERLDGGAAVIEVRWSDKRAERTVGGLVLTLRDVTEQRQLERELKYRAFHDSLTGLPNRVLFQERVVRALARSRGTELRSSRARWVWSMGSKRPYGGASWSVSLGTASLSPPSSWASKVNICSPATRSAWGASDSSSSPPSLICGLARERR